MNIYAVGDIHGCYDQLLVIIAKIKAHAGHVPYRVIFLGDYVDRGPKSRECVNQIRGLVSGTHNNNGVLSSSRGYGIWQALKGNHEDMMIQALAGKDSLNMWACNGGAQTRASYEGHEPEMASHAHWLSVLPTMIQTEHHVFVHAGVSPRYLLTDQPEEVCLWIRSWERADHDFGKHIVYGHTPAKEPALRTYSTGLDTGAAYGGPLTCGVFDDSVNSGPTAILTAQ